MEVKLTGLIKPNIAASKSAQPSEPAQQKGQAPEVKVSKQTAPEVAINNSKAVFAIQNEKYVVIQFLDKEGQVVKQIPPKELINAYERLQESIKRNYDKEA
ncbi:MAG: flagellar protein FlaG [Candidatus Aquicultor sp.]